MAANPKLSYAAAAAMLDGPGLNDMFDNGSYLNIYTGTQPTDPDASIGGATLLATLPLNFPAFGAASDQNPNARMTLDNTPAITAAAVATGTAAWGRYFDSNDVAILDDTVGTSLAGIIIQNTSVNTGQDVTLSSATITMPQ